MIDFGGVEGQSKGASDAQDTYWTRGELPPSFSGASAAKAEPDVTPMPIYGPPAPTWTAQPKSGSSRKRLLVVGSATVIVIAAIAIGVTSTNSTPNVPGAGVAPAAFVVSSTQNTLEQKTADLTMDGVVTRNGRRADLQGTGTANFDTNSMSATISSPANNMVERELVVGGHFYMGVTIQGHDVSEITGGAHWIDVPIPEQSSSSLGAGNANVDPIQQIQTLEQKGAKVVQLGTSHIDGDIVSGFAVTPSRAAELHTVQQEIQSGNIPRSVASGAMAGAQAMAGFTLDVYVDSNQLLRRMTFAFPGGGSGSIGGRVTMTFSNYGTPVTIAPPSRDDVIGFDQFVKDAQAAGGSTS